MASIRKIALTPTKWVFKKVLHRTLLRFPGGNAHSPIACVYCPEMCRFSCPTAVVSANDAVTPCNKMGLLYKESQWPGRAAQGGPLWPIYDCTGCGRCTEYCVYGVPVAQQLFAARSQYPWDQAQRVAGELTDQTDPIGDLADELGDAASAQRRVARFAHQRSESVFQVKEPRSLYFLQEQGYRGELSWQAYLDQPLPRAIQEILTGGNWLIHESVWMNRSLNQVEKAQPWIKRAQAEGISLVLPAAQGRDCIDCGGEGAYRQLFPTQAKQMVEEIWNRDQHRASGILCFSDRCANHFREVLGSQVPIFSISELYSRV